MRTTICRLLAAAILSILPAVERAAAGPRAAAPADPLNEEMILFQELPSVFGASKYEQKTSEAPASVTIITADEIETYGHRTLADVLRSVRGFTTTYDRNYTYVGARGFGRTGDYNTRVLLLVDGHRTNDSIYDSTYFGTESILDVDVIDRVEVIRGPSSSLYGTNAYLAVINVITRTGRGAPGAEVTVDGGSLSTYEARAAWGGTLERGADLYVAGGSYDSGGGRLYFPEYDAPSTDNGRTGRIDDDASRSLFARLGVGKFTVTAAHKHRDKNVPTAAYGTEFNDGRTRTTDARGYLALRWEGTAGRRSRVSAAAAHDTYRYDGDYMYATGLTEDYGYGRWWSANAQMVTDLSDRHRTIGGLEFRTNSQQEQGVYGVFADEHRTDNWALFLQDEFRPAERVLINVGLRHDDYDTFGGTTNPRVAVIFGPRSSSTVKLLYGTAFRAPNAYELFYDDGGASQKANPGLEPETIATWEATLEHTWRSGLRAAASLYHYAIEDLITLQTDPGDGLAVFRNVERVRVNGAELELEGRFGRLLEGRVSYAWQDGEDRATGGDLINSPRHLAKLHLSAPFARDRATGAVEALFAGGRLALDGSRTPAHTVVNLVLTCRGVLPRGTITAGIYNAFDEDYGDPAGEEHAPLVAIPQDGRSYRIQVRYRF
ncbi:MAG: TonB-dependent receptor plug domain-containing protein [Candidatus Polarisedimenticolia bacterium]